MKSSAVLGAIVARFAMLLCWRIRAHDLGNARLRVRKLWVEHVSTAAE